MQRRTAFTLVEVLVAMALTLFIMTILSAAFVAATQTFTDLKSAGDLAERLRAAANVLRRDLAADHCYDANNRTLPISNLWGTGAGQVPPASGFFRIYQGSPYQTIPAGPPATLPVFTNYDEGADLDGNHSFISTNHALHFTEILPGHLRSDFLSAFVGAGSPLLTGPNPVYQFPDNFYQDTPGVFNAQTAEVAVFLVPTGEFSDPITPPALPLYALYRRQFLTVPSGWKQPASPTSYSEVSTVPLVGETPTNFLGYNTLQSLNVPVKRFWMDRTESGGIVSNPQGAFQALPSGSQPARYPMLAETDPTLANADLLLSDVISFDVRVLVDPVTNNGKDFGDLFQLTGASTPAVSNIFSWNNTAIVDPSTGQQTVRLFDTWTSATDQASASPAYDYSATGAHPWNVAGTGYSMPIFKDSSGNPILVKALQITLRAWDYKTKKTRQVTIVQQM